MLTRTVFELRAIEGRDIYIDRPVASMSVILPTFQLFNMGLLQPQQHSNLPDTTSKGCPGSPNRIVRETCGFECRKQRPTTLQQVSANQHPHEL